MTEETKNIIKTSALQGIYSKYQGQKDCLMADIVCILEAPSSGGEVAYKLEQKLVDLAQAEIVLERISKMFGTSETKEKGCCSIENGEASEQGCCAKD